MLKKQLIMEKALELFSEQGFEATSVQQITERCGIFKRCILFILQNKRRASNFNGRELSTTVCD